MTTTKKKLTLSRRSFMVGAGAAAGALAVSQMFGSLGKTANVNAESMAEVKQNKTATDILVIGGGMAGAFAAVAAREQGLSVTLIDKGTVGRAGSTPWANGFCVFDESRNNREEWLADTSTASDYLNNHDWFDQWVADAADRWDDLESWGLFDSDVQHPSYKLRDELVKQDVTLIERTMVTNLLQDDDGRVIGAMGFSADSEESVVVLAKATIMCAGAGGFKAPGFPIHNLTSDGDAMAYRAGAVISGKEWCDFHFTYLDAPASCWAQWEPMFTSGIRTTNNVFSSGMTLNHAFTAHQGLATVTNAGGSGTAGAPAGGPPSDGEGPEGGPPSDGERPEGGPPGDGERPSGPPQGGTGDGERPEGGPPGGGEDSSGGGGGGGAGGGPSQDGLVLGAATGLGIHKAEGIWPTGMDGACNVTGLYAAGDALASMLCGASYTGGGVSLSGSAVQGRVAGLGAASYAQTVEAPFIDEDTLAELTTVMFASRERETGFTPAWVTQVLQNAMFPYYVLLVKQEDRMLAALNTIMFIQEHLVPYLVASDAHELRLAHETANMALNAEMKLRSALFRTESRGTHFREDYPARDDDNWLAWTLISQDADGSMALTKEPVPDAWKPDPSVDYEERYPTRFPGELEYLGLA